MVRARSFPRPAANKLVKASPLLTPSASSARTQNASSHLTLTYSSPTLAAPRSPIASLTSQLRILHSPRIGCPQTRYLSSSFHSRSLSTATAAVRITDFGNLGVTKARVSTYLSTTRPSPRASSAPRTPFRGHSSVRQSRQQHLKKQPQQFPNQQEDMAVAVKPAIDTLSPPPVGAALSSAHQPLPAEPVASPTASSPPPDVPVHSSIRISDARQLHAHDRVVLSDVPPSLVLTPHAGGLGASGEGKAQGVFLGSRFREAHSWHVFRLGVLRGARFLCCFRFKLWWMTQRVGSSGREVPVETQFLLLELPAGQQQQPQHASAEAGGSASASARVYVVVLPLLDGSFRAALQGSPSDHLEVCLESGDPQVCTDESLHAVYMHSGTNPYSIISDAVKAVEQHTGSFLRREEKQLPGLLDCFGWCTWDAFYTKVDAQGVKQGLASLAEGNTPAKFLIIDDGWQSVAADSHEDSSATITVGTQYASRLTDLKANYKFKQQRQEGEEKEGAGRQEEGQGEEGEEGASVLGEAAGMVHGLGQVVREVKAAHDLKYVYVWHALMGYWGGVRPHASSMQQFDPALVFPVPSPSILLNQPDMAHDSLTLNGLGVVSPAKVFHFYDALHGYLAACGVDGVKVDVQNILETLGAGYGGRVALARGYHEALERSVAKNFEENGVIACMSHNTDGLYSAKQTAVVRASDDFWPTDPASHTVHIVSVAYNSLFLGEFMQPDWDMFHSLHPAAEFHAAARAVGGCAVYVSDKPGQHDFGVLRKLVLPDGSVLRAKLPGRPTRDCLFADPARDHTSMLKIWTMNACGGMVGAFNCQGAGWCRDGRKYTMHNPDPDAVTGTVAAADVDLLADVAAGDWTGDVAVFSHNAGELVRLPADTSLVVHLHRLEFELYTIAPITVVGSVAVAPIGLTNMYNSGGAVLAVRTSNTSAAGTCVTSPDAAGVVDGAEAEVAYTPDDGRAVVQVPFRAGATCLLRFAL
ncbi:unnamed protein product [Closterium sp. Yama58-4]|nr:unnamed protein product [Closterium sp. Yama58-4]